MSSGIGYVALVIVSLLILPVVVGIGAMLMRWLVRRLAGIALSFGNSLVVVLVAGALAWAGNAAIAIGMLKLAPGFAARATTPPGAWIYLAVALANDLAMTWLAVALAARGEGTRRPRPGQALLIALAFLGTMAGGLVAVVLLLAGGIAALSKLA